MAERERGRLGDRETGREGNRETGRHGEKGRRREREGTILAADALGFKSR